MPDTLPLQVRDERLLDVLDPEPPIERLATGFAFTEGPIWHPTQHWLMFSDIPNSRQHLWTEDDGVRPFRTPSNMANGNCFDLKGRILSCEHGTSALTRHEYDGRVVAPLATHWEGKALNSPNDVVIDRAGRIYFTDPPYGRMQHRMGVGYPRERDLDFQGVYRLDPDGSLHLIADDFEGPNGLCLSPDERHLYVSDTPRYHIRRFDRSDDGSISGGEVFAPLDAEGVAEERAHWVPDGLKSDVNGVLFSSGPGGVHVVHADGTVLGIMLMPEKTANFCFGMAGRNCLMTTSSTSLYRVGTRTRGPAMIHGAD